MYLFLKILVFVYKLNDNLPLKMLHLLCFAQGKRSFRYVSLTFPDKSLLSFINPGPLRHMGPLVTNNVIEHCYLISPSQNRYSVLPACRKRQLNSQVVRMRRCLTEVPLLQLVWQYIDPFQFQNRQRGEIAFILQVFTRNGDIPFCVKYSQTVRLKI